MVQTIWTTIQERITSNQLARFGLSLMIALFLWGWVTMLEDPVQTQRYAEIAITEPDLPGALKVVTSLPRATVTVKDVSSKLDALTRADIDVSLDTTNVDGPGVYQLSVLVNTDRDVRDIDVTPDSVSVEIEELISRNFPLTVEHQQFADESRMILDVNPEVSEVTATGTRSAVDRISKVVLPVTVQDQSSDFVDMITPYAVDNENQRIQEVTLTPAHIRTEVMLEKRGKTVSVVPQVTGSPADGFVVQQQVAVPATVVVDGPQDLLDDLLFISTAPVDITGATQSISDTVPLVGLPDGVTLVDLPGNEIEVRVAVAASGGTANLIPDMPIEVTHLPTNLTARVEPETLDIRVSAPPSRLRMMTADDITVTIDVTGLGPGVYTLEPTITVPDDVTVTSTEPGQVIVLISDGSATPTANSSPQPDASDS